MRRQVIKDLKQCGLNQEFVKKIIILGILEQVANSYKLILKLPFKLIQIIFAGINWLSDKIEYFCLNVLNLIENIKDIQFINQEDKSTTITTLKQYYNKQNTKRVLANANVAFNQENK